MNGHVGKDGRTMHLQIDDRRRTWRAVAGGAALALALGGLSALATGGSASAQTRPAAAASARVAAALAAAAPVTVLTGTSCAPSCDIWAQQGVLPGITPPVTGWGFTAAAADALTGQSPTLVVDQDVPVTVTLHNALPAGPFSNALSLSIPGGGLPDDTVGVGPAGQKSYQVTFTRPGTYVYQAGHTAQGTRQVAMGLVGAVVVRPTGYDAALARTDLGSASTPTSGFDDEAVLVLTDLDPAFNAATIAGTAYDMRSFNATYRLINGKAFPQTQAVATAPANRVLLRYVNGGAVSHSMGTQGARQDVLAIDAHPGDGGALVADTLPPGETEDALVQVPAAGGPLAVYDQSGRLDTNGQKVGSTNRVAFGGMMTLLSTDPVPPGGDVVGPTASAVSASPTTTTATGSVTVTASFSDVATGNSNITRAELLVDGQLSTVAPGSGIPFVGTFGSPTVTAATATLSSAQIQSLSLAQGTHTLWVRAQDSAATGNWGAPASTSFFLASTGASTTGLTLTPARTNVGQVTLTATGNDSVIGGQVDSFTYQVDATPAVQVSVTPATIVNESATFPAGSLQEGSHTVSVRSHDTYGLLGPAATATLVVDTHGPTVTTSPLVNPNPTNGLVGDQTDPTALRVTAGFTDDQGSGVVAAEGRLCPTAGVTGPCTGERVFPLTPTDGAWGSPTESAYGLIPLSELTGYANGQYQLQVRAQDSAGNWGGLGSTTLVVQRGIFSDAFEATPLVRTGGWGGVVGSPSSSTTAVITGLRGLLVTAPGPAYVRDFNPNNEPVYSARFLFNPNSLVTGNGANSNVTVFGAMTTNAAGYAAQVQYHRVSTAGGSARQVRLHLTRANGTTVDTAWITIPAGASTLQLDWRASTSATVTLKVNGAATSLTGQNTGTQRIDEARLGLVTTATGGTAYFDAFQSDRSPLT